MLNFKKMTGLMAVLCLLLCLTLTMGACQSGDTTQDTQAATEAPATEGATEAATEAITEAAPKVTCAFTVKDQDGNPVVDVTFAVKQGGIKVAEATSDADGKATVQVPVGSGVVEFIRLPENFEADSTKADFSDATATMELTVRNITPNGEADRPFVLIEDSTNITLSAKSSVYYIFYGGANRYLLMENTVATITHKEQTYAPDENGNVTMNIVTDGPREPITFAINNPTDAELTVTLLVKSVEGSLDNPVIITKLNTPVTATVPKEGTVYYKWVATLDGVLMVSSDNPLNNITLTNQRNSAASYFTDGSACEYIVVKTGDTVLVSVGSNSGDGETDITFTLSATVGSKEDPVIMGKDRVAFYYEADVTFAYSYTPADDTAKSIKVKGASAVVVMG